MNEQDARAIITIASIAAMADGEHDASEQQAIADVATQLGVPPEEVVLADAGSAAMAAAQVARRLSAPEAKNAAYQVALAVCAADGYANTRETLFLGSLAQSLGVNGDAYNAEAVSVASAIDSFLASDASMKPSTADSGELLGDSARGGASHSDDEVDRFILDQAMLSAALELLPDRLANIGILPLQLRLVHLVGQKSGQAVDGIQVKELLATFGVGAAAQVMERVVRRTLGGLASGLLGGLLGGASGVAAGGAVTFASTYAIGHAAKQYYKQGKNLSAGDLRELFGRLKADGSSMYPKVQERIAGLARGNTLQSIMQSVRGETA